METFTTAFKALSNDTRWQILGLLRQGPLCVNALVCRLKVSQSAVSQHLKLLEHAGLVRGEKMGLQVHYALVAGQLQECIEAIEDLMPTERKEANAMCQEHKEYDCWNGKDPKGCSPE